LLGLKAESGKFAQWSRIAKSMKGKMLMRKIRLKMAVAGGLMLFVASLASGTEDVVTAIHGTITKLDAATKTVVVKTADGTEHSVRFVDNTAVHGAQVAEDGAKDSFRGLKEGTEVIAHYTEKGGRATALEIDRVGKDGLKGTEGTISKLDRAGRTIAVKTADGTEHTFELTGRAAKDGGKDIGEAAEKGTKVVVYSTEKAGKDIAHFFEKS
jgi:preprotein translocase subunit YajC